MHHVAIATTIVIIYVGIAISTAAHACIIIGTFGKYSPLIMPPFF